MLRQGDVVRPTWAMDKPMEVLGPTRPFGLDDLGGYVTEYRCRDEAGGEYWIPKGQLRLLNRGGRPTGTAPAPDLVNQPPHYTTGGIETIDFIRAKQLDYCLGNVVKYITRAPHKGNEVQDLKKARWYLDRAISERKDNLNKERDQ